MTEDQELEVLDAVIPLKRAWISPSDSFKQREATYNAILDMEVRRVELLGKIIIARVTKKQLETPKLKGTAYREAMNRRTAKKAIEPSSEMNYIVGVDF